MAEALRRHGWRNLVYLVFVLALLLAGLPQAPGIFALGSLVFFGANAALALGAAAQGRETRPAVIGCLLPAACAVLFLAIG